MKRCYFAALAILLSVSGVAEGQGVIYNASALWTENNDIAMHGPLAYCAYDAGLAIINVGDPTNPRLVGSQYIPSACKAVAYVGEFAYLAASERGLAVVRISSDRYPLFENFRPTMGNCSDIAIFDSSMNFHFALAATDSALQVFDLWGNPHIIATFPREIYPYSINKVFTEGDRAYWLHSLPQEVLIFDISNPNSLDSLGVIPGTYDPVDGFARDNILFLASQVDFGVGMLQIYNVADPASPVLLGQCPVPGDPWALQVTGDYAFVSGDFGRIVKFDVSDPTNPREIHVNEEVGNGHANNISISGSYAYLANSAFTTFEIYDISYSASLLGAYDSHSEEVLDNAIYGDYSYAACAGGGLVVVDVSNRAELKIFGRQDGFVSALDTKDNYLYTVDPEASSMKIYDISNRSLPTLVGNYSAGSLRLLSDVSISGQYAYLACKYFGFQIVDVSNPASPQLVVEIDPGSTERITVKGNYLHSTDINGYSIYDIGDPSNPQFVGAIGTNGFRGVFVSGDTVYAANIYDGLYAYDISDPSIPSLIWNIAGKYNDVIVVDSLAYAADVMSGLKIIDISNPLAPEIIESFDTPGTPQRISVSGNLVSIADRTSLAFLSYPGYGCDYIPGDINGNGVANGIDVTFGVGFFKGAHPPIDQCDCPPIPYPFYAAGDVNGDCAFNGIDITYYVNYLKGIRDHIQYCPSCPPIN